VPKIIADSIDRLISIEMRFAAELPRGVIRPLYDAARAAQGGDPLVYLGAEGLRKHVSKGDHVLIVTGAGSRLGLHKGETDGPLGAASLGRVLDFGMGARTVLVCDPDHNDPIVAAVEAAGVSVIDAERLEKRPHSTVVEHIPPGDAAGKTFAKKMLDKYKPTAVVFIEKAGPNAKGIHHSIMGTAKAGSETGHAYHLADQARERGIFTLGFGDGGNEIGNGIIYNEARKIQPYGVKCQCPCGDGVATVTKTDVLVSASISNWGAYGVAAQLAYALKDPDLFQSEEMEDFMLHQCVAAGGTDGAYAAQILYVDGTSRKTGLSLVNMLHEIIRNGLKKVYRGF
jgi:hypothetical protein